MLEQSKNLLKEASKLVKIPTDKDVRCHTSGETQEKGGEGPPVKSWKEVTEAALSANTLLTAQQRVCESQH